VCTASWLKSRDSLHFFFNRDELRTREPASPPAVRGDGDVRWLSPVDGRAHGTWIGATERGLVLALLNRSEGVRPVEAESRGLLIPGLIAASDAESLVRQMTARDLGRFAPFRLLALWRTFEDGVVFSWNGDRIEIDQLDADLGLLCSSGLGDARATESRNAVWTRMRDTGAVWTLESHRHFHRDHTPEPSAWSVCVHRPEAATVSFTEVELAPDGIEMRYHAGPPCEHAEVTTRQIPLRPASSGG